MISDNERHMNALALHLEKDATNTFWINQMLNDEIDWQKEMGKQICSTA